MPTKRFVGHWKETPVELDDVNFPPALLRDKDKSKRRE